MTIKKILCCIFAGMKLSPNSLKWVLRTYPPFFFQRIWIKNINKDFSGARIKIIKSFLNINSNKTVFGGTIFSALDPIYPILLDQIFKQRGIKKTVAWLKSARIEYLKPGKTSLFFDVKLKEEDIKDAFETIDKQGKVVKTFTTEVFDKNGTKCAVCYNEIYIRNLNFDFRKLKSTTRDKINQAV